MEQFLLWEGNLRSTPNGRQSIKSKFATTCYLGGYTTSIWGSRLIVWHMVIHFKGDALANCETNCFTWFRKEGIDIHTIVLPASIALVRSAGTSSQTTESMGAGPVID